jgi:hypothetical protein
MPTNQDIVLNLVAKLDQGNIQSEVQNMANSMTTAFESAFENLGQRLAQQMLRAFQSGGQTVAAQVQSGGMGAGPITDISGRPISSQQPVAPAPMSFQMATYPGATGAVPLTQFQGGFQQQQQPGMTGAAAAAAAATAEMMNLRPENRLGMRLAAQGRDPLKDADFGYEDYGGRFAEARSIIAARKAGVQVEVTQEQRQRLEEAQEGIKKTQEALVKEIFDLNDSIRKNTQAIKEAPDEQKAALRERVQSDIAAREESRRQTERLAEGQKDIGRVLDTGGGVGTLTKVGGAALALSQIGGAAMQIPGAMRQREVALAGMEGMAGRAAATGDIEKLMAAQQLGGFGAIEQASMYEQAGKTGVAGLGIAGGAALGAGIGSTILPGLGTTAGALVGGGIGLANFIGTSLGFAPGQRSLMEERLGVERAKSPEFYEAMQRSRGLAMGGFEAARAMGAPELAMLAAGGGAGTEALMQQDVQLQNQMQSQMHAFRQRSLQEPLPISVIEKMPFLNQGLLEARSNIERTEMSRADLQQQIAASRQYSVGGQSLRNYAAEYGVGPEQLSGIMQRSIESMGGAFLGRNELMQNMPGLGQMARLTGMGFAQAPELAGALARSGEDRGRAMEDTRQMFEDAVSSGLDKARVGQALMTTAQRVEQIGLGGAQAAQQEQRMALAAAQAISGGGPIEGAQMGLGQRTIQMVNQMATGESGLGMVGGMEAARQFSGEMARKIRAAGGKIGGIGSVGEMQLQQLEFSGSSLREFYKRRGVSEEALSQIDFDAEAERLKEMRMQKGLQAVKTGVGGSEEAALLTTARSMGIKSADEMYAMGRATESIKRGGRPTVQGLSVEEIDKYGFPAAEQMAKERAQQQMEADVTSTQAGQMARQQAQIGALQAGAGMQTLDQQAGVLAIAFQNLAERTNQLFAEKSGKKPPEEIPMPVPQTPMTQKDLDRYLKGNSSSMPVTRSAFGRASPASGGGKR